MFVRISGNGVDARHWACLGALVIFGCDGGYGLGDDDRLRTTLASTIIQSANDRPYYESNPNNIFAAAEFVDVESDPRIIHGTITGSTDVDVYNLGPVRVGDRIVGELNPDASLDGAIAFFDGAGTALLVNDHRNVYLGRTKPFVDVVIRQASDSCYVAASATPGYRASGDYTLLAYKQSPVAVPPPRPDTLLLVFTGADHVRIGSRLPIDAPPFDAADIDPVYAGQTSAMVDRIVAAIREDYTGFDLTILSTSEDAVYDGSATRLFFGTLDDALLGVAENVDEFNATGAQEAIVFTDTFGAFMALQPTVPEMAQAIANVGSHEAGHLLGLVHTSDTFGIMDVTASLRDLLSDQDFRLSPLHLDVFPIGSQDSIRSLLDSIGGDPILALAKYVDGSTGKLNAHGRPTGPSARAQLYLSGCGCGIYDD